MSEIIFAQTRTFYKQYEDLWRVVTLSGYPLIYVDEIDANSDNLYILCPVNGEWKHGWQQPRARIAHWLLEWNIPEYPFEPTPGTETWTMDAWQAAALGVRYVPIGSHPDLRVDAPVNGTTYDVAHIAYMTWRRQTINARLTDRGVTQSPISAWDDARASVLINSRAYLHVHQHDGAAGVPGLRAIVAAAYRLPLLSESYANGGIHNDVVLQAGYDTLADDVERWLDDPAALLTWGAALHERLCVEKTFRKVIDASV